MHRKAKPRALKAKQTEAFRALHWFRKSPKFHLFMYLDDMYYLLENALDNSFHFLLFVKDPASDKV